MTVIYLDTETGGTEPHHPTIELGAVAVDSGTRVELASFEQCIVFDPDKCDPEALKLNHYDPERWREAVWPDVAARQFAQWLQPYRAVPMVSKRTGRSYDVARMFAYNVPFDQPRVKTMFGETTFMPCEMLWRDVLQAVLFYFDKTPAKPLNYKLSTVAKHFGLSIDGAHGALADARLCARVWEEICR